MKDLIINLSLKQKIIICAIFVGIILVGFVFVYRYYYSDEQNVITNESENNTTYENIENEVGVNDETSQSKFGIKKEEKKIKVYVIGEVNTPGVVTINEQSRIVDAIEEAGGKTENADLTKINLAYILDDGVQITVPRIGDNNAETYIREDAGENVISEGLVSENQEKIKVNINTANLQKLETLPGVGETTAQKIIDYRNQNGKFSKKEDLKNVNGIGDSKYEKIKEYIEVK